MMVKLLHPGLFLLALACFTLPFMKISCNNTEMVHARGYNMAFGHTKEKQDSTKSATKPAASAGNTEDNSDVKMQPLILWAFIALAVGLLFSLMGFRFSRYISFVSGFVALALFVYYYFDYKNQLDINSASKDPMMNNIKIRVDFLYGYWLALAFSLCAAVFAIIPPGNSSGNIPHNDQMPLDNDMIHDLAIENSKGEDITLES